MDGETHHVVERADWGVGVRPPQILSQAEIPELELVRGGGGEHDVLYLQVAVGDAILVEVLDCGGDLLHRAPRLVLREHLLHVQPVKQVPAPHELHHQDVVLLGLDRLLQLDHRGVRPQSCHQINLCGTGKKGRVNAPASVTRGGIRGDHWVLLRGCQKRADQREGEKTKTKKMSKTPNESEEDDAQRWTAGGFYFRGGNLNREGHVCVCE